MPATQPSLFAADDPLPPGFMYRADFVSEAEERALAEAILEVPFTAVEMRGRVAKRRTAHFGWTYAYRERRTGPGPPIPGFLLDVRARAATWAGLPPEAFAEALITEYGAGAGIGWHRDAPMFGDVIAGVSLLGACRMRFRPYRSPAAPAGPARGGRPSHAIALQPRSAYLISGAARRAYEHSIPATDTRRYSITFRTLRPRGPT